MIEGEDGGGVGWCGEDAGGVVAGVVAELLAKGGVYDEELEFGGEISGIEGSGEEAGKAVEDFFAGAVNIEGDSWAAGEGGFAAEAGEMGLCEGGNENVALGDEDVNVGAFAGEGDVVVEVVCSDDVMKESDVGLAAEEASEA